MKCVAFFLLLISCFSIALTAEASVCRNYGEREIYLLLKRSATNSWEGQLLVSSKKTC